MPSLSKRLKDLRYVLFYGLVRSRRFQLATLGDPKGICQWTICPTGLNAKSVVYSGGLGNDVTFEHDLVKHFGCDLVLYDPSPAGLETMALPENKIPQFHFFPVALAGHCGKLSMAPPLDPTGNAWFARDDATAKLEAPCTDLASLMRRNGHDHIDLLKIDIEGSEYEVIDDFLKRRIPIRQVCVEFHHSILPGIRRSQSIRSMLKLMAHGYKLAHYYAANHTFVLGERN